MKSHNQALLHTDIPNINKLIWKMKASLKIKNFLWYLRREVILTKDNLVKRNWQGSKTCCFYHKEETIKHLFFDSRFVCSIWSFYSCCDRSFKTPQYRSYVQWLAKRCQQRCQAFTPVRRSCDLLVYLAQQK